MKTDKKKIDKTEILIIIIEEVTTEEISIQIETITTTKEIIINPENQGVEADLIQEIRKEILMTTKDSIITVKEIKECNKSKEAI